MIQLVISKTYLFAASILIDLMPQRVCQAEFRIAGYLN
jgi:hypothetical protein